MKTIIIFGLIVLALCFMVGYYDNFVDHYVSLFETY
jgi:hypothetical protein